ncbi:hypothetical protein Tco_0654752 [Tanacetum coccineum]|uniref:Uncharacterized protein n=1 Tax=Tanacetum coccineum TaxID=301880 RepID=A0ABQ4X435_9ASTR
MGVGYGLKNLLKQWREINVDDDYDPYDDDMYEAIERRRYRQEVLDINTFDSAPKLHTRLNIEIHASKVYTKTIYLLIQKEITEDCWSCTIQEFKMEEGYEMVRLRDKNVATYRTLYTEKGEEVVQECEKVAEYNVI